MILLYFNILILYKKPLFSEVGRLNFVQYVFVLVLLYFLSYSSLELILSSVGGWRNGFFMEGLEGLSVLGT